MASKLNIYNAAFAHLGEPTITAFEDAPTPNVAKANAQWDMACEVAMSMAPWLCCLDSVVLTQAEASGDWRYPFLFWLPGGALRVFNVEGGDAIGWQAGARVDANKDTRRTIKARTAGPLYVDVVMSRPVEALTPLLADALGWELASRLAGPILSSEKRAEWCTAKAEKAYALAASSETTEIGGQEAQLPAGPLALARRSAS